jgi:hypothetical protein
MKEIHIVLTAEARNGITAKHAPSEARLIRMLQGTDEKDMPTTEQVRWMAFRILAGMKAQGKKTGKYTFSNR